MRRTPPPGMTGFLVALLGLAATSAAQGPASGPIGFAPGSRGAQKDAEDRAVAVPTPDAARAWLRALTEEPHVAGTLADSKTAVDLRDKLASWGWEAAIAEYEVLLNYPVPGSVKLEILRPEPKPLKVTEDSDPADKDSASPDAFPAFHGYGVSGDVTGPGRLRQLRPARGLRRASRGSASTSKARSSLCVMARSSAASRSATPRSAGRRGILIYSDPADDGYGRGDVYPNGPYPPRLGGPARERAVSLARPGRPVDAQRRRRSRGPSGSRSTRWTASRSTTNRHGGQREERTGSGEQGQGVGEGDRAGPRGLLRDDPLAADRLRRGEADPRGPGRPERPDRAGRGGCRSPITSGRGRARSISR